jgi:hypothetical protein
LIEANTEILDGAKNVNESIIDTGAGAGKLVGGAILPN